MSRRSALSMKLKIYFRPLPVVVMLVVVASLFWLASVTMAAGRWLMMFAVFYTALSILSLWSLGRIARLERPRKWAKPERLLILAPHEDDCVIAAGGIGIRNGRLGGATRVVYLAPDETPGLAGIRAAEARAAWAYAGVPESEIHHIPLLPPLRRHDPAMLHEAVGTLRAIIQEYGPTTIVAPMFEGGHVHHDMLAALLGLVVVPDDKFEVFEAPEYSPYVSANNTPHRTIALCARWLFGLVSYYGPPDGIDGRPIELIELAAEELDIKRRMLGCFASQNAPSLVATRAYPDRLVRMKLDRDWHQPFAFARSYLRLALAARRALPRAVASGLFPGATGTIGRDETITDWPREWSLPDQGE
jgi:LmbE family N-acetylglucosaminyl deacetylase